MTSKSIDRSYKSANTIFKIGPNTCDVCENGSWMPNISTKVNDIVAEIGSILFLIILLHVVH